MRRPQLLWLAVVMAALVAGQEDLGPADAGTGDEGGAGATGARTLAAKAAPKVRRIIRVRESGPPLAPAAPAPPAGPVELNNVGPTNNVQVRPDISVSVPQLAPSKEPAGAPDPAPADEDRSGPLAGAASSGNRAEGLLVDSGNALSELAANSNNHRQTVLSNSGNTETVHIDGVGNNRLTRISNAGNNHLHELETAAADRKCDSACNHPSHAPASEVLVRSSGPQAASPLVQINMGDLLRGVPMGPMQAPPPGAGLAGPMFVPLVGSQFGGLPDGRLPFGVRPNGVGEAEMLARSPGLFGRRWMAPQAPQYALVLGPAVGGQLQAGATPLLWSPAAPVLAAGPNVLVGPRPAPLLVDDSAREAWRERRRLDRALKAAEEEAEPRRAPPEDKKEEGPKLPEKSGAPEAEVKRRSLNPLQAISAGLRSVTSTPAPAPKPAEKPRGDEDEEEITWETVRVPRRRKKKAPASA